jgi:twitching motility two-component system response regulator PilH
MSDAKEVLIVDDNEANVIFLAQILEDNGFRFRIARDGKEALAALGESLPDLVLLDIMMPRKSGVHVFGHMKGEPDLSRIPVIFITGATEATGVNVKTGEIRPKETYGDDLARGMGTALHDAVREAKPDGFIEKPIEPQSLVAKVNELLR